MWCNLCNHNKVDGRCNLSGTCIASVTTSRLINDATISHTEKMHTPTGFKLEGYYIF